MPLPKRNAVTAIELLVVIAIVGILMGLIVGGVMVVRGRDQNATTNIEISEFRAALERFKAKYGVYPPSQITISNKSVDPQLQKIWPNISQTAFASWPKMPAGPVTLKGDQCLVLFLGGYHDAGSCYGLSSSKTQPFTMNPGDDREPPLFKFKGARLHLRNPAIPFYSYGDGFYKNTIGGSETYTCYAYFCPLPIGGYQKVEQDGHCNTMLDIKGGSPLPYKDGTGAYLNRESYQIISSGKDGQWGGARQWSPGQGLIDGAGNPASGDNITNFAGGLLAGG